MLPSLAASIFIKNFTFFSSKTMAGKIYQAADFILDTATRRLLRGGETVCVSSRAFDILEYLIENHGKIVKKSDLLENVWADSFVEESNLPVHISALRRVLGEKRGESRFIKTIPGRGYSFVAPLAEIGSGANLINASSDKPLTQENSTESLAIAVLPLTFDATNADFEYLANGITQSLIDDLSQIPHLKVLAYSAVRNYRHSQPPLEEIGFLLGANRILTGHISEFRDKLEIRVELLNVADKSHIWSAEQQFDSKDIFRVKKAISFAIAEKLKLKLTESNRSDFAKQQEIDAEAQKLYFRGKFVLESRQVKSDLEEGLLQALNFFHLAIKREPNYALAYTGIGGVYGSLYNHRLCKREEAFAEIQRALETALRIDNRLSQAYTLKGFTETAFERKFAQAEKSLDHAIELNPNNAEAYNWKSVIFMILGKFEEALAMAKNALLFDPNSILFNEHLTRIPFYSGNYYESILQAEELLAFEKHNLVPLVYLALSYAHLGLFREALGSIEKAVEFRHTPETVLIKAYILALMNDKIQAETTVNYVLNQFPENQIDATDLAYAYSALNETEKAFGMLEKAYKIGSTNLCALKIESRCENLRRDPRFETFLAKIGLS